MKWFHLSILLLFFSCTREKSAETSPKLTANVLFSYSKNIHIEKLENQVSIQLYHAHNQLKIPLKRVAVNGSSTIGYLKALNLQAAVQYVTDVDYIYDETLRRNITNGQTIAVGSQSIIDLERLLREKPDAFFSYSDPNLLKIHERLEALDIPVILIDEYKEDNPLARAEWIKLFGILFGKEKQAETFFKTVETNYQSLITTKTTSPPLIMTNVLYGDLWYSTGKNTYLNHLIADAGGLYVYAHQSEALQTRRFETYLEKAQASDFWINAANFRSLQELRAQNENYRLFTPFRNQQVYALTGSVKDMANNYFEEGATRPDLILTDLKAIFSQKKLAQLHYYKRLEP